MQKDFCNKIGQLRTNAPQQEAALLNYFVGEREQFIGDRQAERLRGFDIDDKLELGRLFNRQIGRVCPSRYPINVFGHSSEDGESVRPIGQQAARIGKFADSGD